MKKKRVAYQGAPGAYSEVALREYFGTKVEALGFELSEQVVEAVRDGEADHGILPVENSIIGNVDVNMDLFVSHEIYATGEQYIPIEHRLLAPKGSKLEDIKTVKSHPVALAQCRDFLNRHHIEAIPEFDTGGASKLLAEQKSKGEGTIASSRCAELYGLDIVEEHIQKVRNNITRFLVFVRTEDVPKKIAEAKTALAFEAKHKPGSLLRCLQTFADYSMNMTKLESRPIPENPFVYTFFVELDAPLHAPEMEGCLEKLKEDTDNIKILGSYSSKGR